MIWDTKVFGVKLVNNLYNKVEHHLSHLSDMSYIKLNSFGRKEYEKIFLNQKIPEQKFLKEDLVTTMWGIKFRNKICNSAGTFKNGDGYDICARLGAGAFVGGTSTYNPREGNTKKNIKLPFVKLPKSRMTINCLGLPNKGDEVLSKMVYTKNKIEGCPIGWSVMKSPDFPKEESEDKLIKSLFLYQDNKQIDFIEINVSCPNVKKTCSGIIESLDFISEEFLKKRKRHLPIIAKLSNDVTNECLDEVLTSLVKLKFDGVNLGNTSTDYSNILNDIHHDEKKLYSTFTSNFNGGIGGRVLKSRSLALCELASKKLKTMTMKHEFHIIRTGGIENYQDLVDSDSAGVSFNQWQTGFFYSYLENGNNVYKKILNLR